MRPPKLPDEDVRRVGLQLRQEMGTLTIDALRAAVGGGYERISRIVREINADPPTPEQIPVEGAGPKNEREIPSGLRSALDQVEQAIRQHAREVIMEADNRARESERALIDHHERALAAAAEERAELERYLDDMDALLAAADGKLAESEAAADELERRTSELDALLNRERAERDKERQQTERGLRTAQESVQKSVDALRTAQSEKARVEAELTELRATVASERECHEQRYASLEADRDEHRATARRVEAERDELQRALDLEREAARRLQELLSDRLAAKPGPAMSRGRTKATVHQDGGSPDRG